MFPDPPIDQTDAAGYETTFAASADGSGIDVSLKVVCNAGDGADNVMVWVDGELVVQWYDGLVPPGATKFKGHDFAKAQDGITFDYAVRLKRHLFPVAGGVHEVAVGVFDSSAEPKTIGHRAAPVNVPPAALPAVSHGRILRAAFWSAVHDLQADPALLAAYKAAGFNCIHDRVFGNPCYGNLTYEQWRVASLDRLRGNLEWCRANGLLYWGTGEEFARMQVEWEWMLSSPWAEQAARETFALAREYPEWVATSMVDEKAGEVAPLHRDLCRWSREEGGPPMSWPNQRAGADDPWEASDVADFADRYYAVGNNVFRHGRPNQQPTTWTVTHAAANLESRRPGQPLAFKAEAMGANYTKLAEGGNYVPGVDEMLQDGPTPNGAVVSIWLPLAYGCTALRVYALDTFGRALRLAAPLDTQHETGLRLDSPVGLAVADALNAVARHEQALLGEVLPPGRVGNWIVGRRPGLTFWINTTDSPDPCSGGPGGEQVYGGRVVIYGG